MKNTKVLKLTLAGILCAVAVVGSIFSFPVFGSKCAPVQHMVNILCAVSLGTLLAFPGSMCGALLCGVVYWQTRRLLPTLVAEVFGTAILGGLCAYPMAILFMGANAAQVAFYAYIIPFLVSTAGGAILSGVILFSLDKAGALKGMQHKISA